MAQIDHKYHTMTLYVTRGTPITHWIFLVLAEKTIEPNIVFIDPNKKSEEFNRVNPQGVLPLLMDQEGLVLYTPSIIVEYLEERFPHPPLLPIYPIMRAKCRQVVAQVGQGWYGLLQQIKSGLNTNEPIQLLQERLSNFAPLFDFKPFFLNDEITLVDCCIAPVLWELKKLNIDIIQGVASIKAYQERLFDSVTFQSALRKLEENTD